MVKNSKLEMLAALSLLLSMLIATDILSAVVFLSRGDILYGFVCIVLIPPLFITFAMINFLFKALHEQLNGQGCPQQEQSDNG